MIESIIIELTKRYNIPFNHVPDKEFQKKKGNRLGNDPMIRQE